MLHTNWYFNSWKYNFINPYQPLTQYDPSQNTQTVSYTSPKINEYIYNPVLWYMYCMYLPLSPNLSHVPHVLITMSWCPLEPCRCYRGDRGGKVGNKTLWLVGFNKIIFSWIKISIFLAFLPATNTMRLKRDKMVKNSIYSHKQKFIW